MWRIIYNYSFHNPISAENNIPYFAYVYNRNVRIKICTRRLSDFGTGSPQLVSRADMAQGNLIFEASNVEKLRQVLNSPLNTILRSYSIQCVPRFQQGGNAFN